MRRTLSELGVTRLVIGHTPQQHINCACGCIYRIDIGLSHAMGGADPEALEIRGQDVRILTRDGSFPSSEREARVHGRYSSLEGPYIFS